VVGSRRPTDYGERMACSITADLVASGVTIVSGLAFGIDAASHRSALDNGGRTAAVFACGLDYIYPPGHASLASRIAESGCILSEFPKGTRPERYNFPIRNRIISGLSDGVVVVEASIRSGALVTAGLALEQGREVFAVPGRADSELSYGANDLIKQGATPVTSAEDIISAFGWQKSDRVSKPSLDMTKLDRAERSLFEILSIQPIHVDELGRKSGLGPARTTELLLSLEIKGFIMRKPGNYVVRA
jgi:DNA processing protein